MLARSIGQLNRIKDAAGTAVLPYEIDLANGQSRVPSIHSCKCTESVFTQPIARGMIAPSRL
jgi:hypothetical protein